MIKLPEGLHPSTAALVEGFATALAEKLRRSEIKYGWSDGWKDADWQDKCLADFNHHIDKGDPRDVAAYCAFMWFHGWQTKRLNATAQPVSDGWVSVPRSLTGENGAKAALFGEFSVQQNIVCHECLGEGCDDCNGQGHWTNNVPVDWTTIKEIWAKGVEHFLAAAPGGQDD